MSDLKSRPEAVTVIGWDDEIGELLGTTLEELKASVHMADGFTCTLTRDGDIFRLEGHPPKAGGIIYRNRTKQELAAFDARESK